MCAEEIVIRNWDESPVPGPYHGHPGLHEWWRSVTDPDMGVDMQMFGLEELVELGESRFVVLLRATGRGRASGFEVDQAWGAVIGVEDGKIVSAHGYPSRDEVLAAAGLPAERFKAG